MDAIPNWALIATRRGIFAGLTSIQTTVIFTNDLGGELTQHPDVAKVAFTGSTATGRKVMASVAGSIKRSPGTQILQPR